MQAQARYSRSPLTFVARDILRTEGLQGFYRGITPIVLSTGLQKSVLFAANAGARRTAEENGITGISAVVAGGVASGTARMVVETPFE